MKIGYWILIGIVALFLFTGFYFGFTDRQGNGNVWIFLYFLVPALALIGLSVYLAKRRE